MIYLKKMAIIFAFLLMVTASVVGAKMAMELKASCTAKVEAGQTCTNCIKVEDMVKVLGLNKP